MDWNKPGFCVVVIVLYCLFVVPKDGRWKLVLEDNGNASNKMYELVVLLMQNDFRDACRSRHSHTYVYVKWNLEFHEKKHYVV
jgi:hypothetical protein